ncbi:hypothetical protein [Sphingobium sp. CFD-2]|uniref:phage tail assembly protein T n=1 Tax=Sphingobium sp. CFD-2 TaxID=2878542 RepID=UPI00214B9DA2|nr:hypothetical protein [Sphingobium sp. CFD-2]
MSAREYGDWKAFWELDPQGEQRADIRMSRIMWATLQPHTRSAVDPTEFMPFPDDVHDLPEDVTSAERQMMAKLKRTAGNS